MVAILKLGRSKPRFGFIMILFLLISENKIIEFSSSYDILSEGNDYVSNNLFNVRFLFSYLLLTSGYLPWTNDNTDLYPLRTQGKQKPLTLSPLTKQL